MKAWKELFFGGMYFHTFSIHLMGHFLTRKRNLLHRTKMEKLIFVRAPYFLAPLNYIFFRHSLMHSGAKKENLVMTSSLFLRKFWNNSFPRFRHPWITIFEEDFYVEPVSNPGEVCQVEKWHSNFISVSKGSFLTTGVFGGLHSDLIMVSGDKE